MSQAETLLALYDCNSMQLSLLRLEELNNF